MTPRSDRPAPLSVAAAVPPCAVAQVAARASARAAALVATRAALLAATLALSPAASAAESARQWLDSMSDAMQSLNYEGTFVYIHGGDIESMRIVHSRDESGENERLVSLNGEAREIIRDDSEVVCIWPGSKSVIISKSRPRTPFPSLVQKLDLGGLDDVYHFALAGDDRVAGMIAKVVEIRPRDALRYGYRLWIDRDSRLLLRSDLLDVAGEPVEQLMFTEIRLLDAVPSERFRPLLQGAGYTWQREGELVPVSRQSRPRWHFASLPPGFMQMSESLRPMGSSGKTVHHVILSDGLASVSVYIEPRSGDKPNIKRLFGSSQMGGMHAYGLGRDGLHVTAVGEVPLATVRAVGEAVRPGPARD